MFTNFKYSLNNKKDTTLSEQFPKLNRKFVEIQAKSIPPNTRLICSNTTYRIIYCNYMEKTTLSKNQLVSVRFVIISTIKYV